MTKELINQGHQVETQKNIPVFYKGEKVGGHILDQIVDGRIILELKAVTDIAPIHRQQAYS